MKAYNWSKLVGILLCTALMLANGCILSPNDEDDPPPPPPPPTEKVTVPKAPTGPEIGKAGQTLSYGTGGSSSNLGNSVEYRFDWGDGTFSSWSANASSSNVWTAIGSFAVKAQARSATNHSVISVWSGNMPVSIGCSETVTSPSTPSGPSSGNTGQNQTFATGGSTNSCGNGVQYQFDWGDGTRSDWSASTSASHSYTDTGTYTVKAQARSDSNHSVVSSPSGSKAVTIGCVETITAPSTPSGPASGNTGQSLTFAIDGSTNSCGNGMEYQFDWGDGTFSDWSASTSESHTYTETGTYTVKAQARSAANHNVLSARSGGKPVTVGCEETVTTPQTPTGPSSGNTGQSLTFSTGGSTSSCSNGVEYRFDWGDGTYSNWSSTTSASNTWSARGTYCVKAQARSAVDNGVVSDWSGCKMVTIEEICDLSVTQPQSGFSIEVGKTSTIRLSGGPCTSVDIELWLDGRKRCDIRDRYPNDGDYSWNVDDCNGGCSNDYQIRVACSDDASCYDMSDMFTILVPETTYCDLVADASIMQEYPDMNFDGSVNMVGWSNDNNEIWSLLKFDLTDVPPGAEIKSAHLELYSSSGLGEADVYFDVNRAQGSWNESIVTWDYRRPTRVQPENTFGPPSSAGWYSYNVTAHLESWFSGNPNHGFVLSPSSSSNGEANWHNFANEGSWMSPKLRVVLYRCQ